MMDKQQNVRDDPKMSHVTSRDRAYLARQTTSAEVHIEVQDWSDKVGDGADSAADSQHAVYSEDLEMDKKEKKSRTHTKAESKAQTKKDTLTYVDEEKDKKKKQKSKISSGKDSSQTENNAASEKKQPTAKKKSKLKDDVGNSDKDKEAISGEAGVMAEESTKDKSVKSKSGMRTKPDLQPSTKEQKGKTAKTVTGRKKKNDEEQNTIQMDQIKNEAGKDNMKANVNPKTSSKPTRAGKSETIKHDDSKGNNSIDGDYMEMTGKQANELTTIRKDVKTKHKGRVKKDIIVEENQMDKPGIEITNIEKIEGSKSKFKYEKKRKEKGAESKENANLNKNSVSSASVISNDKSEIDKTDTIPDNTQVQEDKLVRESAIDGVTNEESENKEGSTKRTSKKDKTKRKKDKIISLKRSSKKKKGKEKFAFDNDCVSDESDHPGTPAIVVDEIDADNPGQDKDKSNESVSRSDDDAEKTRKERKLSSTSQHSELSVPTDGEPGPRRGSLLSRRSSRRSSKRSSRRGSSSGKASLLEEELDEDPEFNEHMKALIKSRRMSKTAKKWNRISKRRKSAVSSGCDSQKLISDEEGDDDGLDMYRGGDQEEDEAEIFENIKLQKEIIESVRYETWPIKKKIKTVRLAKAYVERYEGKLSKGRGYQEAGAKYLRWFKREFINFLSLFIPWEMRIKKIESHFGSVVASYFTFLRWMFWLNMATQMIFLGLIVLPEIMMGSPEKPLPEAERASALDLNTFFDFKGYLEHSWMFYGYFDSKEKIGGGYRLPLAYFLGGIGAFLFNFVIILRRMAENARLSKLASKDEQYTFNWKLFTGWDFMIGNPETSKNKAAELVTSFKESILEEQERQKVENRRILIFLRGIANFLVLVVLASSTYAINLVVERSQNFELMVKEDGYVMTWWEVNEVSIVMSLITALFPSIFDVIGLMEKYHPRVNLRWQLARILVLYLLNLYTLMFALYHKIVEKNKPIDIAVPCNETTTLVYDLLPGSDVTLPPHNCTIKGVDPNVCWETELGQEMAKLTLFDLVTTVVTIIAIDFLRGVFVRYMNKCWFWDLETKFPEYGEFKVAENLLHLINNQAMIWLGMFFSPLLVGLNILKLLIMLYTRSWAVLVCNIPPERIFKASRSNNFYYAISLLMLFLATVAVLFLLVNLNPSVSCGPFREYSKAYLVLTDTMDKELPDIVNTALDYLASPGVIIPLFMLLAMSIYYLLSLSKSMKEANKDLQRTLEYERTEEKRKIYAMADARKEEEQAVDKKQNGDTSHGGPDPDSPPITTQPHNHVITMENDAGVDSQGVKVLRVPGMTWQEAMVLKDRNPGLRVMTADEARQANILPPSGENHLQRLAPRTQALTPPPVAVVHGSPIPTTNKAPQYLDPNVI